MGMVNVDVGNVSAYMAEIRKRAKGKVLASVNKPGVRTKINTELYWDFEAFLPYDTGAFHDSPLSEGMESYERLHGIMRKDVRGFVRKRYAQGKIDDKNITFDPYEVYKDGSVNHYASKIRNLRLNARISRSTRRKKEAIAKILIQEANHE